MREARFVVPGIEQTTPPLRFLFGRCAPARGRYGWGTDIWPLEIGSRALITYRFSCTIRLRLYRTTCSVKSLGANVLECVDADTIRRATYNYRLCIAVHTMTEALQQIAEWYEDRPVIRSLAACCA